MRARRMASVATVGLCLLAPAQSEGQILVLDENTGELVPPTVEQVLGALRAADRAEGLGGLRGELTWSLRQEDLWRPAEAALIVEELVAIALSDAQPPRVRRDAMRALERAGAPYARTGAPFEGAFDAMRRVYEELVGRVPRSDWADHIGAAIQAGTGDAQWLDQALTSTYGSDPYGRGLDYLLRVLAETPHPRDRLVPDRGPKPEVLVRLEAEEQSLWEGGRADPTPEWFGRMAAIRDEIQEHRQRWFDENPVPYVPARNTTWCLAQDLLYMNYLNDPSFSHQSDEEAWERSDRAIEALGIDAEEYRRYCIGWKIRMRWSGS